MKRLIPIILPLILLLGIAIAAARLGLLPRGTPLDFFTAEATFIRSWKRTLISSPDAETAENKLKANKEGGAVVRMEDGTWVAVVMEHHCCTGAGFDATLYVTSEGETWLDSDTCYCGWESLEWDMAEYSKKDIRSFLADVCSANKKLSKL